MLLSIICVSGGAAVGAILRWLFGLWLNPLVNGLPLGTLSVNLLGSLIMGILMALFALYPQTGNHLKLLAITGFLGSFTTFSAFAGEMATLLQGQRYFFCALGTGLHVFGSIIMVFAGMGAVSLIRKCLSA